MLKATLLNQTLDTYYLTHGSLSSAPAHYIFSYTLDARDRRVIMMTPHTHRGLKKVIKDA